MILIILYVVSLGVFWLASQLSPFLLIPIAWITNALSIPSRLVMYVGNVILTFLLLSLTEIIWAGWGYGIGLFPYIVAFQNFLAVRSDMTNQNSKAHAGAVVAGCILFIIFRFVAQ